MAELNQEKGRLQNAAEFSQERPLLEVRGLKDH